MDEIERFRKKAAKYREALDEHPYARLLELYPILWYLERHRTSLGENRRNLKIVDLMSGSGFLSENLAKFGYTKLHAVEFCEDMFRNASVYNNKTQLHHLTAFDHLEGLLDELQPDVIISLASFPHLIVYENGDIMDKDASERLQAEVIDICMRTLKDNGILIIADLIESDVVNTSTEEFKSPMKDIAEGMEKLGVSKSVTDLLKRNNTVHGASARLLNEFSTKSCNQSLKWFREIVDTNTTVRHKDVAISNNLLEKVSRYKIIVTKYTCPWMFGDEKSLKDFVYKKFGFCLDETYSSEEIENWTKKYLGIRTNYGNWALGWNLGLVILGKREPFREDKKYKVIITALLFMAIVMVLAIFMRFVFGIYGQWSVKDVILFLFTLPLGIIIGNWLRNDS